MKPHKIVVAALTLLTLTGCAPTDTEVVDACRHHQHSLGIQTGNLTISHRTHDADSHWWAVTCDQGTYCTAEWEPPTGLQITSAGYADRMGR